MIFAYTKYQSFLKYLQSLASIKRLQDWQGENSFILRHDVDLEIEAALALAKVEQSQGVRSSFFFLTSCDSYNICSQYNRKMLQEIHTMGFEIALHFDPTIYCTSDLQELTKQVDKEASLLADIVGESVKSVSLHNPSVHGFYPMFEGYRNAYDPAIFSHDNYLSDSRMSFRGKDPFDFVTRVKHSPLQILLHPMHFSDQGQGYRGRLCEHIKSYCDRLESGFRENSSCDEELGNDSLLSLISKTHKPN